MAVTKSRTAANPYLPAETNPFGQQKNPFVPMNETIEQGIAPTEPEGPRVVTGPDTPETAKPRGNVTTVDATLRMKVAVVCEACGQRGMLRLGKVSERTRCRCGSRHVELLEASRKTSSSGWVDEGNGDLVKYLPLPNDQELELVVTNDFPFKWYIWVHSPSGSDMLQAGVSSDAYSVKQDAEEAADFWSITVSSSRKRAEKECTCWEGYERVPGTEPCASGSCRKKSSRRRTGSELNFNERIDSAREVAHRAKTARYILSLGKLPRAKSRMKRLDDAVERYSQTHQDSELYAIAAIADEVLEEFGWKASARGDRIGSRRTASGWMKSLNPHHFYKTVVKNGYELNLFASDVDYRWAVDVMVAGDSSTLEMFEQGFGANLEDAKREAEQSAQFFQG